MSGPPSPLIENYLRKASFWHMANIGWECKLDPKLISAFIRKWRLETHTFHLPCGECTITLEDMQLQLRLSVDRFVLIGFAQSLDWGAICYDLLGTILDNIYGGQTEMGWLRDTFLKFEDDSTEVERIRYARAYIFEIIGASYVGIPIALEDIRLLLDQWSKVHGPLNSRRRANGADPSTGPMQSPGPMHQAMTSTPQPLQIMPGAHPSLYMYPNSYMFHFLSPMLGWNVWLSASSFPMTPTQLTIYRPLS
ncbi:hypothetical protein CXB51_019465 [Gossypium anomalum]|uniref:Aminotransferase-like plant mobile domain-containing protein n=1 Tax=Gossypium anomalum TaxID=47600 RepID=A0A8J6CWJ1_9ROSI|nr:hypothetical protein CXB51_019465 [Gossypium anomalum]